MASTVLITGANRGIGLEFARQYVGEGRTVFGTARDPDTAEELRALDETVTVLEMDVTDRSSIHAAREKVEDRIDSLDLLINNAGTMGSKDPFDNLDPGEVIEVVDVNCVGALRVTQSFMPLLSGGPSTVACVTSLMGSIEDNRSGGSYAYRISKAGMNMFAKTLSEDVDSEWLQVALLHPGWVQTRMGGPNAKISTEESVNGMRDVLNSLGPEDHGKFIAYDGEELPW